VLDAAAMIAFLRDEQGADVVENALIDTVSQCVAHSINLCEIFYISHRRGSEASAQDALNNFRHLGMHERGDIDEAFWQEAGRLKSAGGISLPDCFAITLTNRVGGTLLTSDHGEMDKIAAAGICNITFIR
jgi:PIN domain nuclease of toxin-antitoxin system